MTRAWRAWQAEENQIEKIEATEKRLKVQARVKLAKQEARLYGGAGIYIGTEDTNLEQELLPERVKLNGIKYLHVMSRWELTAQDIDRDPLSPYYGEPTAYTLSSGMQGGLTIHPSRVVRFIGRPVPRFGAGQERWGDSELQILDDALKQAGGSLAQVATLFNELKVDIVSVPGLSSALATAESTARLTDRFAQANLLKSAHNVLLLEGGAEESAEKWETRQIDFGAFPAILQLYLKVAAGAADIPVTRLLNDSPSGMQSTGDSDTTNYYDRLSAEQNTDLTPELERLDEMLIRSALGARPPEVHYRWNPLWQMSEAQKADIALKKAQATQIYITTNAVPEEVISVAVRNQLQEDGTYPGIDAAYDEYDAKVAAGEIVPGAGDDDDLAEPAPTGTVAALLAAAGGGTRATGGGRQADRPFADAFSPDQKRDRYGRWTRGLDDAVASAGAPGAVFRLAVFGVVRKAARLKDLTEVDTRGFRYALSNHAVAHTLAKHGNESTERARGQIAITAADFALLPKLLPSATVERALKSDGRTWNGAHGEPRLTYQMSHDGVAYTIIMEIKRGKGRLDLVTMRKRREK